MRLAGSRLLLFLAFSVLLAGSGCENPFDPLNTSDKIQGLTYFDFSATQEHWDSDPEWDGVQISMSYYNEYGDSLSFHDKPHKIQIEFWSQKTSTATPPVTSRDQLLVTKTVTFSNSDDLIRIPIEYYYNYLPAPATTTTADSSKETAATTFTSSVKGYLLLRVYPPQEYPQKELDFVQGDVEFFTPETAPVVIDTTTTTN